jgi:hypothetical protein
LCGYRHIKIDKGIDKADRCKVGRGDADLRRDQAAVDCGRDDGIWRDTRDAREDLCLGILNSCDPTDRDGPVRVLHDAKHARLTAKDKCGIRNEGEEKNHHGHPDDGLDRRGTVLAAPYPPYAGERAMENAGGVLRPVAWWGGGAMIPNPETDHTDNSFCQAEVTER